MTAIFNFQFSIFNQKNKKIGRVVLLGLIGLMGILIIKNSDGWDSESWNKRVDLMKASWEMIKINPLLGMGAGNFVVKLPEYLKNGILWLQPVHNIFLLMMSEIGLIGVGLVGWIMKGGHIGPPIQLRITNYELRIKEYWMIIVAIVITGMGDHYWLTLPQNMWLMAVVLVIMERRIHRSAHTENDKIQG